MLNLKKLSKVLLLATALTGFTATVSLTSAVGQENRFASPERVAVAQAAKDARPRMKSMQGMTERPFKTLTKVQDFMAAEPPQYDEAMALLKRQNLKKLNPTELASFYQLMAAVAQSQDNINEALGYYKQILALDSISYAQRDQMTFIVGQIEFSNGNYDVARGYFEEWLKYQPDPSITNIVIFANVYYASGLEEGISDAVAEGHYRTSIEFLNWAVIKAKATGKPDKENWYAVLRAIHNTLDETDKVIEYAELLATRWPKKEYWTQLSGLYAQAAGMDGLSEEKSLTYEKNQLAAYELAYRQGMLETGRELETMAQLYLFHDSPYQSSKTMTKSFASGASEKNRRNYELQGSAFVNGKDMADAVDPLTRAAELSENGNIYMRVANVYLNLDKYLEAADAIEKALEKGGISRPDQSGILQGQAYLSLEMFDEARTSFREAGKIAKDDRTKKMSRDLLRYVDSEEKRIKDIKEYLS